jgi:PTH2 family peptidyl-tRNA hydrolase
VVLSAAICAAQSEGAKTLVLEKNEGEARVSWWGGYIAMLTASTSVTISITCLACPLATAPTKEILGRSNTDGQTKIALAARSLAELDSLKQRCDALSLTHILISDAGRTELAPGTVTALAVRPAEDQLVDKVTGSVALLR